MLVQDNVATFEARFVRIEAHFPQTLLLNFGEGDNIHRHVYHVPTLTSFVLVYI